MPWEASGSSPGARGGFPKQALHGGLDLPWAGEGRGGGWAGPVVPEATITSRPPRPWSWTPSVATTGASRAAAPSPGRTCCLASTGSWMTSPAASSWPTEPLVMPPHSAHSPGTPHPASKHPPWKGGSPPAQLTAPAPLHTLLLLLLPTAALWPAGSRGGRPVTLAVPLAPDPARLQLRDQEERAVAGRGLPLLLSRLWASPFAQL